MKNSSFCCFCFSQDRKTSLIENSELEFFKAVFKKDKELLQQLHNESKLKICFECRGRIKSMQKLIIRAKVSMQILKKYWSSNFVLPVGNKMLSRSKKILIQYLPPKNLAQTAKANILQRDSKNLTQTVQVEMINNYWETPEYEILKSGAAIDVKQDDKTFKLDKSSTLVGNGIFNSMDIIEHRDIQGNQQRQIKDCGISTNDNKTNNTEVEIDFEDDEYSSIDVSEIDIEDIILAMATEPDCKQKQLEKNKIEDIILAIPTEPDRKQKQFEKVTVTASNKIEDIILAIPTEPDRKQKQFEKVTVTASNKVKPTSSAHEEDIEDILLAMVTGPLSKTKDCERITVAPSTSSRVEQEVVRVRTSSDDEFEKYLSEEARNKYKKKSVTNKPIRKSDHGWLNMWVSEQQAHSWYQADIEQQACVDNTCFCDLCKQGFKEKEELKRHLYWHHYDVVGGVKCNICKYIFKNHLTLHQHAKHHYVLYKCDKCDYKTRDLNLIQAHTGPGHITVGNEPGQMSTLGPATILNFCNKCKLYFTTESQFVNHAELYGCFKVLTKCDFCSKVFANNSLKVEHMQRFHNQPFQLECDICKRKYKTAQTLKNHMQNIHNSENHMEKNQDNEMYCKLCDTFFKSVTHYNNHIKRSLKHVDPEHRVKCPHCDRYFTCPEYLQRHIGIVHLNIRTFKCQKCPKMFTKPRLLKLHVSKVHDKTFVPVRDQVCDVCGKSYLNKCSLEDHKNIHTGARPFECPLCPKTFAYKASLFTHNKLVHLKQKRPCDLVKLKKKPKVTDG